VKAEPVIPVGLIKTWDGIINWTKRVWKEEKKPWVMHHCITLLQYTYAHILSTNLLILYHACRSYEASYNPYTIHMAFTWLNK